MANSGQRILTAADCCANANQCLVLGTSVQDSGVNSVFTSNRKP